MLYITHQNSFLTSVSSSPPCILGLTTIKKSWLWSPYQADDASKLEEAQRVCSRLWLPELVTVVVVIYRPWRSHGWERRVSVHCAFSINKLASLSHQTDGHRRGYLYRDRKGTINGGVAGGHNMDMCINELSIWLWLLHWTGSPCRGHP